MIIFAKRLRERPTECTLDADAFSTQPSKEFSTKVNHRTYFLKRRTE